MRYITVGSLIKALSEYDSDAELVFVDDKYSCDYDEDDVYSSLDSILGSDCRLYNAVECDDKYVVPEVELNTDTFKHLRNNKRKVAVCINNFYITDSDY